MGKRSGRSRRPTAPPAPAAHPTRERPGPVAATVAAVAALAVVGGYMFVSGAFVTAPSPVSGPVSAGFAPYFSQQWDVFAPRILKTSSSLQMQVSWEEDGDFVHSEWVDVSHIEMAASRGIPMPSRISKSSVNALAVYFERYDALSADQQERVRDTFIEADGDGGYQPIADEELVADITALGESETDVIRFIRYDYMLTRFAAAFGEAYFDRKVDRVRWRAQLDRPNDFAHRFDETRQQEVSELTFGWRQSVDDVDAETLAIFDDVIARYTGGERA